MESAWKILFISVVATPLVSLFGLPFSLALSGAYALVRRADSSSWMLPASPSRSVRRVPFLLLAVLGGLGGNAAAFNSILIGEWWICRTQRQLCYDGQGGIILVVTVPVLAIVGALIAWGWTWLTLRVAPHHPWASIFRYSGSLRWLNWLLALVVPVAFWALVTFGLIRVTL